MSVWAAGAVAVAVLALTAVAMVNGSDDGDSSAPGKGTSSAGSSASAGPSASYTLPDTWTEPTKWAALPRGQRTDKYGSQIAFPRTTEGAMGMVLAANSSAVQADHTMVDEQLRSYNSYVSQADHSTEGAKAVELSAQDVDKQLHRQMGVGPEQALPSGAYMRNTVIGYQVIKASPDEVSAWLLSRVAKKTGETAAESVDYTRTLVGVRWEGGDWKLSVDVTAQAQSQSQTPPTIVAPGDAAFNSAGWTAIREAS